MNSYSPMYPWKGLYANLLTNFQQLYSQVETLNHQNTQLAETLANEILIQQQLIQTLEEDNPEGRQEQESFLSGTSNPQEEVRPRKTPQGNGRRIRKCKLQAYTCPYERCDRIYKSAISLNLHIKMNHNGGTKKEREAYAKQLLEAEQGVGPSPQRELNLPPNFLEQFQKNFEYRRKYNM